MRSAGIAILGMLKLGIRVPERLWKMAKEFIPLAKPSITDSEIKAVAKVLRSGLLTTGPKVTEFENKFAQYIGKSISAVALNSCTAGLYLALKAYGIGRGDEVILPTWTFAATGHVVLWTGAKPVLCDVENATLNIDVEKIKSSITSRTKAIMAVHYAGYPCRMKEIMDIADKYRLLLIEDAAHAVGTIYHGKKIGNFGNVTVFSFYATKNLACGEGGMAVSKDSRIIERMRKLSYFGINKQAFNRYSKKGTWYYEIEELGYKYNMDSIHAAIGLIQLERLDQMNQRRRNIARMYKDNLDGRINFTEDSSSNYHTYHLFPIRINKGLIERDKFICRLKEYNIGTSVHFIPLHRHPFYKKIIKRSFPIADKAFEEIISIPIFADMSDSDVIYVTNSINMILKGG
jgi:dTDP-4-amino-4,6-dideoxygalactose transaminase